MEEQTLFSWIHLSDIHVGHGDTSHGWNQRLVLEALRRDVGQKPGPDHVDWILVTGDVAFSGAGRSPDEYTRAAEWLRSVAEAASVDPRWIWLVPGNHDVNRGADAERSLGRLVDGTRSGREPLDTVLADAGDRALLGKRMSAYLAFAAGFAPWALEGAAPAPEDRLFWMRRIKRPDGVRVRLVGLNTALLSKDDTDHGKLQLGNAQLHGALAIPVDDGEIVICLGHHPLTSGWLSDEKDALGWIRRNAHLHLSGHVHEAESVDLRSGAGGEFVHVVAGAAHGDRMPAGVPAGHGYNFGEIVHVGGGALELRVWPRRWSEPNKEFRADVDSVPPENMRRGRPYATHRLRARLPGVAAPEPAVATTTTAGAATAPVIETTKAAEAPAVDAPAASAVEPAARAAPQPEQERPIAIFYFYSPDDDDMRQALDTHLALLKKRELISSFSKRSIAPGVSTSKAEEEAVESARIYLALVSASFFASDVFDGPLLKRALERSDAREAVMIPIVLRPCHWEETRLRDLQCLPPYGVPISKLDRDEALTDVAWELRNVVEAMRKGER